MAITVGLIFSSGKAVGASVRSTVVISMPVTVRARASKCSSSGRHGLYELDQISQRALCNRDGLSPLPGAPESLARASHVPFSLSVAEGQGQVHIFVQALYEIRNLSCTVRDCVPTPNVARDPPPKEITFGACVDGDYGREGVRG